MSWRSVLKADPTEWLLETDDPSVRYWALRGLNDVIRKEQNKNLRYEERQDSLDVMLRGMKDRLDRLERKE